MEPVIKDQVRSWSQLSAILQDARGVVDAAGMKMFSNGYFRPGDFSEFVVGADLFCLVGWPISLHLNSAVETTEKFLRASESIENTAGLRNVLANSVIQRSKDEDSGILVHWKFIVNSDKKYYKDRYRRYPDGGFLHTVDTLLWETHCLSMWALSFWYDIAGAVPSGDADRIAEITDRLLALINDLFPDKVIQEDDSLFGLGFDAIDSEFIMSALEEHYTGKSARKQTTEAMGNSPTSSLTEAEWLQASVGTWRVDGRSIEGTKLMVMPLSQLVKWVDIRIDG